MFSGINSANLKDSFWFEVGLGILWDIKRSLPLTGLINTKYTLRESLSYILQACPTKSHIYSLTFCVCVCSCTHILYPPINIHIFKIHSHIQAHGGCGPKVLRVREDHGGLNGHRT